jgi:glycosyltransferase involved in cell wall biosynthesis
VGLELLKENDVTEGEAVRIAFCITDLDDGGAERALVRLVTGLDRSRWEPRVFCLSGEGVLAEELSRADVLVTCLEAKSSRSLSVVFRLAWALRDFHPTLLQTYLYHANITGRIAGRLARVPVIVSGIRVAEQRSRFRLWLDRVTQGMVDHHVCVSEAVATFSRQHSRLPEQNITVIPNGVDAELFANAEPSDLSVFGIPPDAQTMLFVGRLDPQKDPCLLLQAMELLMSSYPQLHLLFVGDGPLKEELKSQVVNSELKERVHCAGRRDDVANLMKACDVFVLPSRWEGMPNVVLEAMAAGLPIVATEVEGTAELLAENQTGLLVPPHSPTALAEAVETLLRDSKQAQSMKQSAQQLVSKRFTWNRVIERYEELYRSLTTL